MGCLFENDNKVCTCKIDELAREVCSTMAKEQGYTGCVYIKTNNEREDYLTWLKSKIEKHKEIGKCIEENIEKFKDDETLKKLMGLNKSYIRLLENINKEESRKMNNNEMKVAEAIKKEVEHMTDLEIINNQISIIIEKIDRQKQFDNSTNLVILSEELRELVKLRAELESIENLRKQREQLKKRRDEMMKEYREKEKCL